MAEIHEILAAREKTHGSFLSSSQTTQALKSIMRAAPNWPTLESDQKECLDMVAHKIARILFGDASIIDHYDDGAGYFTLVANRLKQEQACSNT